jgi:hypothetical protein
MGQLFEVKRQGVGGYSQLLGDCARGETILACHDECAEDTEAYLLSKRCKRADNFRLIHFSIIHQLLKYKPAKSTPICMASGGSGNAIRPNGRDEWHAPKSHTLARPSRYAVQKAPASVRGGGLHPKSLIEGISQ